MFEEIRKINPAVNSNIKFNLEKIKDVEENAIIFVHGDPFRVISKTFHNELESEYVSTELKLKSFLSGKIVYLEYSVEDYGNEFWLTESKLGPNELQNLTYDDNVERVQLKYDWIEEIIEESWEIRLNREPFFASEEWETSDAVYFDFLSENGEKSFSLEYWKADQSFEASLSSKLSQSDLKLISLGV